MSENKIPIRKSTESSPVTHETPRYPTEVVSLPTKGWFYPEGHPLSSGEIELKQMTAREEDILANQDLIRKGKVLDRLLQSLIVNKEIDYRDILLPDKNFIFIAIRRLAYGSKYAVSFTCPRCGEISHEEINLSGISDREVNIEQFPKGKNEFSFTLPKSNVAVTYKMLNQHDEDAMDKELAGLRKIGKDSVGEITTRLKYVIQSVNGESDNSVIRKFVDEELLAIDSRALREYIASNTPGIDFKFNFQCKSCDHERRADIPLGASFLWPDIDV